MMFASLLVALLQASMAVNAAYLRAQKTRQAIRRDVYSPTITNPVAGSTWVIGTTVTVTWNTDDAPQNITNTRGQVILGQMNTSDHSEHLDYKHPLAGGFDIVSGNVSIVVPDVAAGDDYIIVLMGDSGNTSKGQFSIVNASQDVDLLDFVLG